MSFLTFRVQSLDRGKDIDSDHFPIFISLSLEQKGATQQKAKKQIKNGRKMDKEN